MPNTLLLWLPCGRVDPGRVVPNAVPPPAADFPTQDPLPSTFGCWYQTSFRTEQSLVRCANNELALFPAGPEVCVFGTCDNDKPIEFPYHGSMNPILVTLAAALILAAPLFCARADDAVLAGAPKGNPGRRFQQERDDVVAFVGGTDVAAALHSGHLESLLCVQCRGLNIRFRNFGWEGDTVFAQPRDIGFPPLSSHLEKAAATVIFLQVGRAEALEGLAALPRFVSACEALIEQCAKRTRRIALVTPPPFENPGGLLPNLAAHNADLAAFARAIRELALKMELPLVDLFTALGSEAHREPRLTDNGLQLTPRGHAWVARAFMEQLGFGEIARRAGETSATGAWSDAAFERVRVAVMEKNRLWLLYWRPQNWAFLGGDRTTQPSSRDHRDPNVRWFPAEIEKFVPLIERAEARIEESAGNIPLQ